LIPPFSHFLANLNHPAVIMVIPISLSVVTFQPLSCGPQIAYFQRIDPSHLFWAFSRKNPSILQRHPCRSPASQGISLAWRFHLFVSRLPNLASNLLMRGGKLKRRMAFPALPKKKKMFLNLCDPSSCIYFALL
jgi:hypothetical protein